MKQRYLQRIFNPSLYLLASFILCLTVSILVRFTFQSLDGNTHLSFIHGLVYQVYFLTGSLSILSLGSFILLVSFEISNRIYHDSVINLLKSIWQTLSMRRFLSQSEHSETVTIMDNTTVTRHNPINKHFNKMVKKVIVDVRNDKVTLIIKLPNKQQATKILKDMEVLISEEISNRNPDFYFSRPERKGKWLTFIGTKRE